MVKNRHKFNQLAVGKHFRIIAAAGIYTKGIGDNFIDENLNLKNINELDVVTYDTEETEERKKL